MINFRAGIRWIALFIPLMIAPISLPIQDSGAQDTSPDVSQDGSTTGSQAPGSTSVPPANYSQCDALQKQLDARMAQIESEHAACLDRYKADRQGDNNQVCSRSECQSLHTLLYGPSKDSGAQQVAACRAAVQKQQARQAAEQGAIQTVNGALSEIFLNTPAAPLDSQSDLANYDQDKQAQAVVGDNSDPKLTMDDSVSQLAGGAGQADGSQNKKQSIDDAINSEIDSATDGKKSDVGPQVAPVDLSTFGSSAVDFVHQAAEALAKDQDLKDIVEPLGLTADALKAANTAAQGQVPTTLDSVDKLNSYVNQQSAIISAISQKSANDWIQQSGVNAFDPSTTPTAQAYLDDWSQRLTNLQNVIKQFTPMVSSAQSFMENPVVNGGRMALAESTLPGLDPIALGEIVANLNACAGQISAIQSKIQAARSVIY